MDGARGGGLLPLVLDEGQQGWAEGFLAQVGSRFALTNDGSILYTSGEEVVAASLDVLIRSTDGGADLREFLGRPVRVTGRMLENELLADSVVEVPSSSRTPLEGPARQALDQSTWSAGNGAEGHGTLSEVERQLVATGQILDAWTEQVQGAPKRVVLAHDVEGARSALQAEHGASLAVMRSSWTDHTLQTLESVLLRSDRLRLFGRAIVSGPEMVVTATLLHLTSTLARELSRLDTRALSLQVLVRPGRPSPR